MFYKFDKELQEAVIVSRPNRFVMEIIINGKKEKAHCPVTGKIGRFDFKSVPCLVSNWPFRSKSKSNNFSRPSYKTFF